MGVKKRLQVTFEKLTSRVEHTGIVKGMTSPSSANSVVNRGIEWLYFIAFFLLAAGVVNASQNAGIDPGGVIVPSPSAQNVTETFIILFIYIVGAIGAFMMYLSGRQTIRARSAEMFFVAGLLLVSVTMLLGYYVLSLK